MTMWILDEIGKKTRCWTVEELRELIERFHAEDEDLNHPDNEEGTSDCGNCYSVDRFLDWLAGE